MSNDFRTPDLKAIQLEHGDVTVTYGGWILARYFKDRRHIFVIGKDAPVEWIDAAVDLLKERFPKWETCTWR